MLKPVIVRCDIAARLRNNFGMAALVFAAFAVGFYAWIIRSAKEVPSPLAVWVSESEDVAYSQAA